VSPFRLPDWLRRRFRKRPVSPPVAHPALGWFEQMLLETRFLQRFPHYAGVLSRMDPVATRTVPVMAVGKRRWGAERSRLLLLVNCEYFRTHPEYRAGVLLHEIQHVLAGHIEDSSFHRVSYPRIMEVAMELTANEPIDPAELPADGFTLDRFTRVGVRPGQSTFERYVLLRDAFEAGRLKMRDLWVHKMIDSHRPRDAGAPCSGLGDVLDARSDRATDANWAGQDLALGAPSSRAEIERMKERIARHLRGERGGGDDAKRGNTLRAKELERVVFERGDRQILDWSRILRETFHQRRTVKPDYLRPNRRFPERVGEVPGRRRRPPPLWLLAAIDTSGSMDRASFARIARELRALRRLARLTIVECDATVHRTYPLPARLTVFIGGGDTDFAPAFKELHREHEGLVYFTDGRGTLPEVAPDVPTLWAVTHDDPFLPDFGAIVRLPA
jgi:hypothetical protein